MKYKIIGFVLFSIFILTCCSKINPVAEDKSMFVSSDGVIMVGKFVPPVDSSKFTFVMLHGLASSKNEWFGFAEKLAKKGYGYFAYDLKGHGESCKDVDGKEVNFKYFSQTGTGSKWESMITDLDKAIKYLRQKKRHQEEKNCNNGSKFGC